MGEALQKRFLLTLEELGININKFPDKSFDGLFVAPDENVQVYLNWFCDYISGDNVLSEDDLATYEDLLKRGKLVAEDQVESVFDRHSVTYNAVSSIHAGYVRDSLPQIVKRFQNEHKNMVGNTSGLEQEQKNIKNQLQAVDSEIKLLERNGLEPVMEDLAKVNKTINTSLQTLQEVLLVIPAFAPCDSFQRLEQELDCIWQKFHKQHIESLLKQYKNHLVKLPSNCDVLDLQENLGNSKATSLALKGKLQSMELEKQLLEKVVKDSTALKEMYIRTNLYDIEKVNQEVEDLEERLLKCCSLQAECGVRTLQQNHHTHTQALESQMAQRLQTLKDFAVGVALVASVLRHHLDDCVESLARLNDLRNEARDMLFKESRRTRELLEEGMLRKQRWEATQNLPNKHPLASELSSDPNLLWSCPQRMEPLVRNAAFNQASALVNENISSLLGKLQTGPTRQLQLMPPDMSVRLHDCRSRLQLLEGEVSELLPYINIQDNDSSAKLVWNLFLAAPELMKEKLKELELKRMKYEE